ncbi:hypothetical protein NDU88_009525 [Pleurodeles waltl]|uniref:Uncharacterized protein n=1 Tax=Pleurodeles waltl TaxID=8319 RepID=A0AAV7PV46_PLEWA|nr:hypothetical protein NDU88_009525 [Pleurodeles waltl]
MLTAETTWEDELPAEEYQLTPGVMVDKLMELYTEAFEKADPDKVSFMGIQSRPAMASGCSLFLDALRSLAHCCLVCISDGQSVKKRQAVPTRLRPSPPRDNVGKSGSG